MDVLRSAIMRRIEVTAPEILDTLGRLPSVTTEAGEESAAFRAWADHWHLPRWIRTAARRTWTIWQKDWPAGRALKKWGVFDLHEKGNLLDVTKGRFPQRPPDTLLANDHLDWWIRARLTREPAYLDIAVEAGRNDEGTVGRAVRAIDAALASEEDEE